MSAWETISGGSGNDVIHIKTTTDDDAALKQPGAAYLDKIGNKLTIGNGTNVDTFYSAELGHLNIPNVSESSKSIVGQMTFDSSINSLNVLYQDDGVSKVLNFDNRHNLIIPTASTTPVEGSVLYDKVNNILKIYNTKWIEFVPLPLFDLADKNKLLMIDDTGKLSWSSYTNLGKNQSFINAISKIPRVGSYFYGGYFYGTINIEGRLYYLIVAPSKPLDSSMYSMRTSISTPDTFSGISGFDYTNNQGDFITYPAAHYVKNTYQNIDAGEWFIPTETEWNYIYLNQSNDEYLLPEQKIFGNNDSLFVAASTIKFATSAKYDATAATPYMEFNKSELVPTFTMNVSNTLADAFYVRAFRRVLIV